MLELAILDQDVCINTDETSCARIICRISLELATGHLDACLLKYGDAGYLTIRLSEYSTINSKKELFNL